MAKKQAGYLIITKEFVPYDPKNLEESSLVMRYALGEEGVAKPEGCIIARSVKRSTREQ